MHFALIIWHFQVAALKKDRFFNKNCFLLWLSVQKTIQSVLFGEVKNNYRLVHYSWNPVISNILVDGSIPHEIVLQQKLSLQHPCNIRIPRLNGQEWDEGQVVTG